MRLKNFLLVVRDMEVSRAFYKELFGLSVIRDFGANVILSEGLVLQEQKVWENAVEREISYGNHSVELYFEESDFDSFMERLAKSSFSIEYINKVMESDWGNRMVRIYDPDKHVIEIREV